MVGSEGGEGVKEGEGVVGTCCIQPENNNIFVVVVNLHHMDATLQTGTQLNTCWQLICVVMGACRHLLMVLVGGDGQL